MSLEWILIGVYLSLSIFAGVLMVLAVYGLVYLVWALCAAARASLKHITGRRKDTDA